MVDAQSNGVLIAEDEDEVRNLLALVLELEQFTVYKASDGQEALDLIATQEDKIVLLITDLGLPKLGGLELIEKVRALKPSIKIIGASGFGHANVREEVLKAGADEFRPKPYVTEELIQTIKKLLNRT